MPGDDGTASGLDRPDKALGGAATEERGHFPSTPSCVIRKRSSVGRE
jgi:hypothetical protein